jgi:hypothetical protein
VLAPGDTSVVIDRSYRPIETTDSHGHCSCVQRESRSDIEDHRPPLEQKVELHYTTLRLTVVVKFLIVNLSVAVVPENSKANAIADHALQRYDWKKNINNQ